MRVERLGDGAVILYELPEPSHLLAKALEVLPGCRDAVPSYDTVGLYFEPGKVNLTDIEELVHALGELGEDNPPRELRVPVCYELGDDLGECAEKLDITVSDLVVAHSSKTYQCFAIGFTPGFPYLGYLAPELSGLPRRPEPRVRVSQGAIGITGRQTGVYPTQGPGGWNLVGRTPLEIVDLADGYFPIRAGDLVTFYPIGEGDYKNLLGERL